MRKIIFSVIIVILLVAGGFLIAKGVNIGKITIYGVKDIKKENATIDQKNADLSNLVNRDYKNAVIELEESKATLEKTKKDYEDSVIIANNNSYLQTEKYEIEFLWTKIGNYAKDRNVNIKIDVANSTAKGVYDLKFAVAGIKYEEVVNFIYDIENDSKLGFKIEDFRMIPSGKGVQATFTCKELNIHIETIEKGTPTTNTTTNETTNNTTNSSTDTNTTTNTTTNTSTNTNVTNSTTTNSSTNTNTINTILETNETANSTNTSAQ